MKEHWIVFEKASYQLSIWFFFFTIRRNLMCEDLWLIIQISLLTIYVNISELTEFVVHPKSSAYHWKTFGRWTVDFFKSTLTHSNSLSVLRAFSCSSRRTFWIHWCLIYLPSNESFGILVSSIVCLPDKSMV